MDNDVFEKSNERMPAPLNAFVSKTVKAGLNIRCILRLTHPANAKVLICETFLKSMEYRFVHPSNARSPMVETFLKSMESRFVHASNALVPMVETFLKSMEYRFVHP